MFPVDGGENPPHTRAAVTSDVLQTSRRMRALLGITLAAILWSSPTATFAAETMPPANKPDNTIVFGLTAGQLGLAAAVGASAGAAGALASSNLIAGASLGVATLAAIYVAHLAAEVAVVGGMYYWWPWNAEPEIRASRTLVIRGASPPGADRTPLR
jgi:hypothetical protein